MIKVMIVDDQGAFRLLARTALETADEFEVVAEARDGLEAVASADEFEPDVVLMDVQMPEMNGFEATELILKRHPGTRVVLVSMSDDQGYARIGEEIGAVGFIPKTKLTVGLLRHVLNTGS